MANEYLFVYGSLRRGNRQGLDRQLADRAEFVDRAVWRGRLFLVGEYPGAVPSDDPTDMVYGEVYCLTESQRLLAELDVYEGCFPAFPTTAEYDRQRVHVRLAKGDWLQVWIYVYQQTTNGLPQLVSGDFLAEQENGLCS